MQKQTFNIYTMMLILSFLALVTACLLLYLELRLHGSYPWWKPLSSAGGARDTGYRVPASPLLAGYPQPVVGQPRV